MGLGIKRTCGACDAKFYDLEKSPIICPKCGTNYDEFMKLRPKKNKKEIDENIDDIELELDDVDEIEALEDLDEDTQIEDLDEEIRESMEMEGDDEVARDKAASDDEMLDLDGDSDGMIDSGDPELENQDDEK
jgi:uncharacterized protein (TIGR02300 family)